MSHRPAAPLGTESLIQSTPGVCGGDACIRRTRIPVWTLVAFRRAGMAEKALLAAYPGLTGADLAAAWEYEREHREEIAQAIRENETA